MFVIVDYAQLIKKFTPAWYRVFSNAAEFEKTLDVCLSVMDIFCVW